MSKAFEVMTHSLATCSPEDKAARVATMMRDRDIGNVLVVEDGKLRGIVTDRDLAVNALTSHDDPLQAPVSKFMSTRIVTGEPDWSIRKVAKTMAKHQVRRLPIIQDGLLAGIISIGDLARHETHNSIVSQSLKAISTPSDDYASKRTNWIGPVLGLTVAALSTTMFAWLTWSHSGQEFRNQMTKSKLYHSAQQTVSSARERVDQVASSKTARNLRQQVRSNLKEFSDQMPRIEYKPARRKFTWFR